MYPIYRFQNRSGFLANTYRCRVEYQGETYTSVEAAYLAARCNDAWTRRKIREAYTLRRARRLGQAVVLSPGQTRVWRKREMSVMLFLLESKFSDPDLRQRLVETYPRDLIWMNDTPDRYWGVGPDSVGANVLGKLLMIVRDECRKHGGKRQLLAAQRQYWAEKFKSEAK